MRSHECIPSDFRGLVLTDCNNGMVSCLQALSKKLEWPGELISVVFNLTHLGKISGVHQLY
jgi:hypothetical protein